MSQRALVLGDSLLKGVVFDSLAHRYRVLKDSAVACFARRTDWEVTNASVFGATIRKGLQQLVRREKEVDDYGYALLEFGGNDCDFDWAAIAQDPEGEHLPNTELPDFLRHYETLIENLRRHRVTPAVMTLPPLDASRFFDTVSRGLNGQAILHWLQGDRENIFRWHDLYSRSVTDLADRLSVPLIDVRRRFLDSPDYRALLCADGMHPNEQGQGLILDTVLDFMRGRGLVPHAG